MQQTIIHIGVCAAYLHKSSVKFTNLFLSSSLQKFNPDHSKYRPEQFDFLLMARDIMLGYRVKPHIHFERLFDDTHPDLGCIIEQKHPSANCKKQGQWHK